MKNVTVIAAVVALLTVGYFFAKPAFALTGDAARFDFTNGQPTTVDNTTSACTGQTTIRYDFTSGIPTGVFDTTATCTAAVVASAVVPNIFLIKGGTGIVRGGTMIVK